MARKEMIKLSTAAAIMLVSVTLFAWHGIGRFRTIEPMPEQVWFYDLETGELFAAPAEGLPPIAAASGEGNGVGAAVYTCGACDEGSLRIGYLERMSDEGKRISSRLRELTMSGEQAPGALVESLERERYVALPPSEEGAAPRWAGSTTPHGQQITERYWTVCGEKIQPRRCNPPQ